MSPCPVRVTTRIILFLVGHPYKPSFATVTGRGGNPSYNLICWGFKTFIFHGFGRSKGRGFFRGEISPQLPPMIFGHLKGLHITPITVDQGLTLYPPILHVGRLTYMRVTGHVTSRLPNFGGTVVNQTGKKPK